MDYKVPYSFVLQYLHPFRPSIKKILGCYALVHEQKLLVLLRDRENQPEFNGVFIATEPKYFEELQREIHTSNMEFDLDGAPHTWLFISEDLHDFKDKVEKACNLIKAGDIRIGKKDE